ncbi:MAG: hypothetical protein V4506_08325 [Bacteroidota bacterium]
MKETLADITKRILHSSGIEEEIEAVRHLSAFYSRFVTNGQSHSQQQKGNEVLLQGGIALSSYDAAICLDEFIRTARFLKGTYLALRELQKRFPGQQLNILYAGCGPYATLILPLLPLFGADELDVLLLDINSDSLRSVAGILAAAGLGEYKVGMQQADAIRYQSPESRPLHMIVSETMFYALIREPQVSITQNLAPQLQKGGILIPEEINLDLVYTFHSEEPYLKSTDEYAKGLPHKHRLLADRLFSINKERDFYRKNNAPGIFESGLYELPSEFSERPDLCIFTHLKIFDQVFLHSAESSITNPYCVTSLYNLQEQTHVKLMYDFTDVPQWTYKTKGPKN